MSRRLKYDPKLHIPLIHGLALAGYSQVEIAKEFKVTESTIVLWLSKYPELRLSWEDGRTNCIKIVERELFKVCQPHIVRTVIKDGNGKITQIIEKECPPSTHAMSLYLRGKDVKYRTTNVNVQNNVVDSWIPPIQPEDKDV